MKKILVFLLLSLFIVLMYLLEVLAAKKVTAMMDMASGYTLTKQLMRVSGLAQRKMAKVWKLGLMDIFIKVNSKTVCGAVWEL